MIRRSVHVPLLVLAAVLAAGDVWTPPDGIPVVCPAMTIEAAPQTLSGPEEPSLPIELVVAGTATAIEEGRDHDRLFEIAVDTVHYGAFAGRTLRCTGAWAPGTTPALLALIPDLRPGKAPWILRDWLPADELPAVRALAAARFDWLVLGAAGLFIGSEVGDRGPWRRTVRVIEHLAGVAVAPGSLVVVEIDERGFRTDRPAALRAEPAIWCVRASRADQRPEHERAGDARVLELAGCLPAGQRAAALDALHRRASHPVRPGRGTTEERVREVRFAGTVDEAIVLLASGSAAAQALGFCRLHGDRAALPALAATATADLTAAERSPAQLRRLGRLIPLLGAGDPFAVAALLDRELVRLGEVATAPSPEHPLGPASDDPLIPLLRALPDDVRLGRWAPRVLTLRDEAGGAVRARLDHAIVASRLADDLALRDGLVRARDLPRRTLPPAAARDVSERAAVRHLAFGSDGSLRRVTAGGGLSVSAAATLVAQRAVALPRGRQVASVRPDGRLALCPAAPRGLQPDDPASIAIVDLEEGRVVALVAMPAAAAGRVHVHWLADGQAACIADGSWTRFDLRSGAVLDRRQRTASDPEHVSDDGRHLLAIADDWRSGRRSLTVLDARTLAVQRTLDVAVLSGGSRRSGLVPDGRRFFLADPGLHLVDRHTLASERAWHLLGHDVRSVAFTSDASLVAIATTASLHETFTPPDRLPLESAVDASPAAVVRVHRTTDGLCCAAFTAPDRAPGRLAFSSDRRRLAWAGDDGALAMWDLPAE